MKPAIRQVVKDLIRDNPGAQRAYQAMIARRLSPNDAEDEIGRVLFACLWHASKYPQSNPPMEDAFKALAEGQSSVEALSTIGFPVNEHDDEDDDNAASAAQPTAADIANAMWAMFEAANQQPSLLDPGSDAGSDAMADVLDAQFPSLTPELLDEAAVMFRARLAARGGGSLPGLPGGPSLKH